MEKKDVPQDKGILGNIRVVCYAIDENGEYVKSQSAGIAWEFLNEELAEILEKVKRKELSPLAYHMNKNLMDVKLLSRYTGFAAWRIKRYLKPRAFNKLDNGALQRCASVFDMTVEQLKEVP
jgi:hypothetical protein